MIRKISTVAALGVLLSAGMCTTVKYWVMDAVVAEGGQLPEPRTAFNYAESEIFERQVYSSLNSRPEKLDSVHITFVGGESDLPSRMYKWVGFVKATQGKIFVCETNTAEGFFDFKWLLKGAQVASKLEPAKDYHMIIEQNSEKEELVGIRFFNRVTGDWATIKNQYNGCTEPMMIEGL